MAVFDPVSYFPKLWGLSWPTYTPTTKLDVNPINQVSVFLLVVPVFPASSKFKSLRPLAVPLLTTPSSIEVIW